MTILFVDTSWPVNTRTKRFYSSLNKVEKDCFLLGWNRNDSAIDFSEKELVFTRSAPYGSKLKKLTGLLSYLFFLNKNINKHNVEIVFCSHWDALLCTVLSKSFSRRKFQIIYDCLDMPSSSNTVVSKVLKFIEMKCLKHVSHTVFASRYFPELYSLNVNKYTVFENYPVLDVINKNSNQSFTLPTTNNEKIVISWIGVVRYKETLINLMTAISDLEDFVLYVFGDGPDLEVIKKYVLDNNLTLKVYFFGRFAPEDLSYIYSITDLVWAAYPSRDENVRYAISNKYFESNLFNVIPIFSSRTKVAHQLSNNASSVVLVDEYDPSNILKSILASKGLIFRKYEEDVFWENRENVIYDFFRNIN